MTTELPAEVEEVLNSFEPGSEKPESVLAALREVRELPIWPRIAELARMNALGSLVVGNPAGAQAVGEVVAQMAVLCGCIYGRLEAEGVGELDCADATEWPDSAEEAGQ